MNEAATGLLPATSPVKLAPKQLRCFWRKVNTNGPVPDQSKPFYAGIGCCHSWEGTKRGGYGRFKLTRDTPHLSAHRLMWEILKGPIPPGMCVLHRCDNPSCVRIDHLFLGTRAENNQDKAKKGRAFSHSGDNHHSRLRPEVMARGDRSGARTHPECIPKGARHGRHTMPESTARGERAGAAKLKAEQVVEIRRRYIRGVTTMQQIAAEFGVCFATVRTIIHRKTWKHIP